MWGGRSRRGGSSESWRNSSRLHGRPAALRMDNGPELTALAFVEWCDERRIARYYIQPGKPDQNAFIERFNRTYSHRGARCVSLRLAGGGPRADRALACLVQPGAAARQPWPGAAPHVSAEAHAAGTVPFRSVYLTGKPTGVLRLGDAQDGLSLGVVQPACISLTKRIATVDRPHAAWRHTNGPA